MRNPHTFSCFCLIVILFIAKNTLAQDAVDAVQRKVLKEQKIEAAARTLVEANKADNMSSARTFAKTALEDDKDAQVQAVIQLLNGLNKSKDFFDPKIAANYNFSVNNFPGDTEVLEGTVSVSYTDRERTLDPKINSKRLISLDQNLINLDGSFSYLLGQNSKGEKSEVEKKYGLYLGFGLNVGVDNFVVQYDSLGNKVLDSTNTTFLTPRIKLQWIPFKVFAVSLAANFCILGDIDDALFNRLFASAYPIDRVPDVLTSLQMNFNFSTPKVRAELGWTIPMMNEDDMPTLKKNYFRFKIQLSEPIEL